MSKLPISEAELQACVDDALPEARRTDVADYLATHPEDAERVRAYQLQKQALRALFNPVLAEPLPENLSALASPPPIAAIAPPAKPFLARWSLQRFAAGFLVALFSGIAGWLAHGQYEPAEGIARMTPLPRQAAVAHAVFSPDVRRPVEVSAENEDQLVAWLSKRMGTPVRPPKLGALGFELIGGRLLPGNVGPVAQFMYQDASGQRLTLYVSTENTSNHETAFRFAQEGTVNVFYWIDGKFGYAISASIDKGELARVATAVYEQIERK
ncbi:anti-sigma factor family protein [Propionivibrio sp.]|uniref:anti-sigma factor family protein n=1 Tax=Propionivibrio sp. TaxID=2212460 RepID=UPI003BF1286F